jgi:hypothetical protein
MNALWVFPDRRSVLSKINISPVKPFIELFAGVPTEITTLSVIIFGGIGFEGKFAGYI